MTSIFEFSLLPHQHDRFNTLIVSHTSPHLQSFFQFILNCHDREPVKKSVLDVQKELLIIDLSADSFFANIHPCVTNINSITNLQLVKLINDSFTHIIWLANSIENIPIVLRTASNLICALDTDIASEFINIFTGKREQIPTDSTLIISSGQGVNIFSLFNNIFGDYK